MQRREFIVNGLRYSAVAGVAVLLPGCARKLDIDITTPQNASLARWAAPCSSPILVTRSAPSSCAEPEPTP